MSQESREMRAWTPAREFIPGRAFGTERPSRPAWIAAVALALAGCDDRASQYYGNARWANADPATLHVNNGSEPEYLDPGKCADAGCGALVTQLFEGLTRYHPEDAHPVQGVALRYDKSDDNCFYRFHLRPDARWSDGRPVTAADFVYAWKRVLRPSTASRAAGTLAVLLNGELYRRGLLKALGDDRILLAGPRLGEAAVARVAKGTVVHVLERSGGYARVERWRRLPTYHPPALNATPDEATRGWVDERALVDDDTVVGVRATDERTLEVELEQPTPYFLDLTSHHAASPVRRDVVEAFERRGEEDLWTRPGSIVTNGPYELERWAFQYEITMKASPAHRERDLLRIRRIVWSEVQDYHATMALYKVGELDWLGDNAPPPAEYLPLLAGKKDLVQNDSLSVYWYELNTRKPPLDDVRVRQALDRAIDKAQIVARITRGGQKPATHYAPDFTGSGYAEEVAAERAAGTDPFEKNGFDPAGARALLAEAGYAPVREDGAWRAPGFPPLSILYNNGEGHRQIAVAVQAMWKENLGVSASLESAEWKVLLERERDGDFQVVRSGQTADYDHPQTFLAPFLAHNPQNHTGWHDDAFESTLARAASAASVREGIRLYRAAERIAVDAMPCIPLYFFTRSTLVKPWVMGFRGSKRNPHAIQFLWIDPDWHRSASNTPASSARVLGEPAFQPPELPPPGRISAEVEP